MSKAPIAFNFDDVHNVTFAIETDDIKKAVTNDTSSTIQTGTESYVNVLPGIESMVAEGSEWNHSNPLDLKTIEKFNMRRMEGGGGNNEGTRLHVKSDDNVHFRVYINGNTFISSPVFINKFNKFMRSRSSGETVIIHLGVMMYGLHIFNIGAILDAMTNCKAKVTTFAGGHCGSPESVIWLHGHSRVFGKYGVLQFDGALFLDQAPFYKHYFESLLTKAKDLQVLTEEQVQAILKDNKTVYVYPK